MRFFSCFEKIRTVLQARRHYYIDIHNSAIAELWISEKGGKILHRFHFPSHFRSRFLTLLISFVLTGTFLYAVPNTTYAAVDTSHIGFVESRLWFDHEPFFAGEQVRVYTMVANSTSADFEGTIAFYDNDTKIGSSKVTLERNGGFQVVWSDWKAAEGEHALSVRITEATVKEEGKEPQTVSFNDAPYSIRRAVDLDTDGDKIGNREDEDDDNDGIPDTEDKEPLVVADASFSPKPDASVQETIERITQKSQELAASTTPKIVAGVQAALQAIENFREAEGKVVEAQKEKVRQKIAEDRAAFETAAEVSGGEGESKRKTDPFNQLQLLELTAAGYTLSNKVAFYLAGALIVYVLLKKVLPRIWGLFRRKESFE